MSNLKVESWKKTSCDLLKNIYARLSVISSCLSVNCKSVLAFQQKVCFFFTTSALLISIEPSVMVHSPMLISLSWLLDRDNSLFQPWTSMPGCFSLDVCHKKSSKGCGAELWQTILDCVWSMYMLNGERYLTIPCWETRSDICLLLDSSPFIMPRGYPRERSQRRGFRGCQFPKRRHWMHD